MDREQCDCMWLLYEAEGGSYCMRQDMDDPGCRDDAGLRCDAYVASRFSRITEPEAARRFMDELTA